LQQDFAILQVFSYPLQSIIKGHVCPGLRGLHERRFAERRFKLWPQSIEQMALFDIYGWVLMHDRRDYYHPFHAVGFHFAMASSPYSSP
jgi:hypothetical protein